MSAHSDSRRTARIRTAVIPAGGQGTRMLPATKSIPKELLPLGERPALHVVIDEALGAGVEHLVVISSPSKPALAEYLAPSPETERVLERQGREDLARVLRALGEIEITIVHQNEARGLGHAVGLAEEAVGTEPFFVLLPDELMESSLLLEEMGAVHAEYRRSVIAVKPVVGDDISRYGVVAPSDRIVGGNSQAPSGIDAERIVTFDDVVEKPAPSEAPSDLAIIGRYLLTPDIFEDLRTIEPGANGEIQLTDALARQSRRNPSAALVSNVGRRDIGHPLGWVQAVVDQALRSPYIGSDMRAWLDSRRYATPFD